MGQRRGALRRPHVVEGHRGGLQARRHAIESGGVERRRAKLGAHRLQSVAERGRGRAAEGQRGARRFQAREQRGMRFARGVGHEDFGGPPQQRGAEHAVIGLAVLADPEVAGGHVEERDAQDVPPAAGGGRHHGEEEVVRHPREVGRVGDRARGDDPHDVAPQELLALAGRLELLADRDLLAGLAPAARCTSRRRGAGCPPWGRPGARSGRSAAGGLPARRRRRTSRRSRRGGTTAGRRGTAASAPGTAASSA